MGEHFIPDKIGASLAAKLASRSRHVNVLLGAGTSKASGLPDLEELKSFVIDGLDQPDRVLLEGLLKGRSLEFGLTKLRKISSLLDDMDEYGGFTKERALKIDRAICALISRAVSVETATTQHFDKLALWARRCNYTRPLELFTLNYDLLLERALDGQQAPYFDGFIGNIRARFYAELVEDAASDLRVPPYFIRVWKLHGSINWEWDVTSSLRTIRRLGVPVPEDKVAAVFPSDSKYEESRRVPFLVLQDRFRRAINAPESLTLVTGYSFSDEHLNELIFEAASSRERSEIAVFCYEDIPQVLLDRALSMPNLQAYGAREAVIGGLRKPWTASESQNQVLWINDRFALCDFRNLAKFLAITADTEIE